MRKMGRFGLGQNKWVTDPSFQICTEHLINRLKSNALEHFYLSH